MKLHVHLPDFCDCVYFLATLYTLYIIMGITTHDIIKYTG